MRLLLQASGSAFLKSWPSVASKRIIFQLEEGTLYVMSDLALGLMDLSWSVPPFDGRIVATKLVGTVWHVATWESCTHFVVAKPLGEELPLHGDGVVAHMGRLGHATLMTQAKGDCGIESLLLLSDSRRGAGPGIALRKEMQRFLQDVAGDEKWHDAFAAAGEVVTGGPNNRSEGATTEAPSTTSPAVAGLIPSARKLVSISNVWVAQPSTELVLSGDTGPHTQMEDASPSALKSAIAWMSGLTKPCEGFLKRLAQTLTHAEA